MSNCAAWSQPDPFGNITDFRSGIRWSNQRQPEIKKEEKCVVRITDRYAQFVEAEKKSAEKYLTDLLKARSDEDQEKIEDILTNNYDSVDLLLAGLENGSDEALTKSRQLLRMLGGKAWPAWEQISMNLSSFPVEDYIDDIVGCPIDFMDTALLVFRRFAYTDNYETQSLLLERIDSIHGDLIRPILVILSQSIYSEIAANAGQKLAVNGLN